MMRSPSSASATSTSRSLGDGMTTASTGFVARASTSDGPPGELRELPHELAGAVRDDRLVASERVVMGDRHLALQDDEHAGAHLAGS